MKRSRSLRWRLVAIVALLLVATNLVIGAVTVFALQGYLLGQVDQNLSTASQRALNAKNELPPHAGDGHGAPGDNSSQEGRLGDGSIPDHAFVGAPGQSAGTVTGIIQSGTFVVNGFVDNQGTQHELSTANKRLLAQLPTNGDPTTRNLEGLGTYRLESTKTSDNTVFITGLPLTSMQQTIEQLTLVIAIVAVAGLIIAVIAGAIVVRRALLPLQRVADTAAAVSTLPLDRGEVPVTVRVSAEDIATGTEVGEVGTALNQLLGHVSNALTVREAAEAKVRTFVADASHELRTPLATIRAYAELSQSEYAKASAALRRNIDRIESESVRMTTLVDELLLLARLDSEPEADHVEVDLSRIVAEAALDVHAASPGHLWHVDLSEDPVIVVGDESQLRQLVGNLLANARTHTPSGTHVRIELHATDGHGAVFEVVDDGPGIDAALLPTLFERFVRGDGSRSRAAGSTGLGLAIVSAVASSHGGTVDVESGPGHTAFRVTFP